MGLLTRIPRLLILLLLTVGCAVRGDTRLAAAAAKTKTKSNNKTKKKNNKPNVCIDVGKEDLVCTQRVLETRSQYDKAPVNVGVTQRIDGSEAEKRAVREVLQQMDRYFFHEVLALPEYDYARSRCKNSNEVRALRLGTKRNEQD